MLMPLYKTFTDRLARIAIWHATEQPEQFRNLLPEPLRATCWYGAVARFVRPARRTEWLAARVLAHRHFRIPRTLDYAPDGRPYIPGDDRFISISHSHGYVAMALSAAPVGIDLELSGDRAWALRKKFLAPAELSALEGCFSPFMGQRVALSAWTAKEAAFKYYAHHIPLKTVTDVELSQFSLTACHAASSVPENGGSLVRHFFFGNLFCSVAAGTGAAD